MATPAHARIVAAIDRLAETPDPHLSAALKGDLQGLRRNQEPIGRKKLTQSLGWVSLIRSRIHLDHSASSSR